MRVTNVRISDLMEVLKGMKTEYCDIELDEKKNTVRICEIIPITLIEDEKKEKPTPEDLEGCM